MLCQTIDEILPVLQMIQQPAFCLREDGTVLSNQAAQNLAPFHGSELPAWLGNSAAAFASWDRTGSLEILVRVAEQDHSVTIQALPDGLLFLMQNLAQTTSAGSAMLVASQVLRQSLTDLFSHVQQLSRTSVDPLLADRAASMERQLHRVSRIAANLTDLELLHRGEYPLRMQRLDAAHLIPSFLEEIQPLVEASGHALLWSVEDKHASFQGDSALLKRAMLNLISNALKYSPPQTTVEIRVDYTTDRMLFRIKNVCEEGAASVLRGAFDRLNQRGLIPDPRWGVGLGLPLVQAIAQAHGGMVALECRENLVTVTLSISRKRASEIPVLQAPMFLYDGGLRQSLLELADCLPNRIYHPDAI